LTKNLLNVNSVLEVVENSFDKIKNILTFFLFFGKISMLKKQIGDKK